MGEPSKSRFPSFFGASLIYILPLSFLFFFCLYPIFEIVKLGIIDDSGNLTLEYIRQVLSDHIYLDVIWFTFYQALISTVLTVLLALPGAYLLSRYSFPGKRIVMAASVIPFVIPSLVLAVGLIAIFGARGSLNVPVGFLNDIGVLKIPEVDLIGTRTVIIIAHVFFNFPIALRILHSRFAGMDDDLTRAARSLGAGRIRTFFTVVVPQLKHSLLASSSLVFTFCFLSFGIVALIGGLNHTLEVEIRSLFVGLTMEKFHHAGALVIIESAIVLMTTMIYVRSSSREVSRAEIAFKPRTGKGRKISFVKGAGITMYVFLVIFLVVYPLLIIVGRSFTETGRIDEGLTLVNYRSIISLQDQPGLSVSPLDAIRNSVLFGFLTMVVSVPLSYLTAWAMKLKGGVSKRFLDMLLLFPLGASSIALGYGLVKAYSGGPFHITGTWYIIVLVHSVIAYPIGARSIYSSMMSVPPDIRRASRSLGASRAETFFRVELPLIMPGILVAAVFAFAVSIGELGATLMVSSEELVTMPVFLYRTIEDAGRNLGPMYAFSVIFMGLTFLSFFAIELVQRSISKWGLDR